MLCWLQRRDPQATSSATIPRVFLFSVRLEQVCLQRIRYTRKLCAVGWSINILRSHFLQGCAEILTGLYPKAMSQSMIANGAGWVAWTRQHFVDRAPASIEVFSGLLEVYLETQEWLLIVVKGLSFCWLFQVLFVDFSRFSRRSDVEAEAILSVFDRRSGVGLTLELLCQHWIDLAFSIPIACIGATGSRISAKQHIFAHVHSIRNTNSTVLYIWVWVKRRNVGETLYAHCGSNTDCGSLLLRLVVGAR